MLVIGFVLMVIPVERPLTLLDRVLMIGNEVFRGGGILVLLSGWLWRGEVARRRIQEKYPVSNQPDTPFAYEAAKGAWVAPLVAFVVEAFFRLLFSPDGESDSMQLLSYRPGPMAMVGALAGAVCSVLALRAIKKLCPGKLKRPALLGAGISLLLFIGMSGVFDQFDAGSDATEAQIDEGNQPSANLEFQVVPLAQACRVGRCDSSVTHVATRPPSEELARKTKYFATDELSRLQSVDGREYKFGTYMVLRFQKPGSYRIALAGKAVAKSAGVTGQLSVCSPLAKSFQHGPYTFFGQSGEVVFELDAADSPYLVIGCTNGDLFVDLVKIEKLQATSPAR